MSEMTQGEQWVRNLVDEIAMADPQMMQPKRPIAEGEKLQATVEDEFMQKVFSLGMTYSRERDMHQLEFGYAAEDDRQQLMRAAWVAGDKAKILFDLFWSYIRESADLCSNVSLGLRENWQVVTFQQDDRPMSIFDIFFRGQRPGE